MKKKFLCFQPTGIETESKPKRPRSRCLDDRVFTCVSLLGNRDAKISVVKSPVPISENSVMFETPSRKKAGNREARQLESASARIRSTKIDKFSDKSKSPGNADSRFLRTERNSPALAKISSNKEFESKTQSTCLKQSDKETSEVKSEKRVIISCSIPIKGLMMILIALSMTIFHGRICAILFTSTCLYILPRRSIRQSENMMVSSDYRKDLGH